MRPPVELAVAETPHRTASRRWWPRIAVICALLIGGLLASGLLIDLILWRSQICLDQRQNAAALSWLRMANRLRPNSAEMHYLLARTYRRMERFSEVQPHLQKAFEFGWNRPDLEREQWLALAQTGQFSEMNKHWDELFVDARSDGPEISKAFVLMSLNRFRVNDALRVIAGWKADFPEDAEPYFQEGRIAGVGLRWLDAEQAYREALKRASHRIDVREGLTESLMKQLKLPEAVKELQDLIRLDPRNLSARTHLADCHVRLGKLDEARQVLTGILQTSPSHYEALVLLGQLETAAGRAVEAIAPLQQAVALHPEDAEVRYAFGRALRSTGREAEAKEHFRFREEAREPLLRLSKATAELVAMPRNVPLRYEVAELTWKWKSRDEGEKWLLSVLEIDPSHQATHQLLAQHYTLRGDSVRGEEHRIRGSITKEDQIK